jgi:cell division septum initiation protein DivIVA
MARPEWFIVLRGYDRDEVDTYLDGLESATTRPVAAPTFRIALRGYDRKGVDAHVEQALAALPASADAAPSD